MKYIVLRDLQTRMVSPASGITTWSQSRNLAAYGSNRGLSGWDPIPTLEVEEIDERGLNELARDPAVVSHAPEMPMLAIAPIAQSEHPQVHDGDPIEAVHAAQAGPSAGAGVTVAVLDTGIDRTHPAFEGVDIEEVDFTGTSNGDRLGHGTHCAGIILGRDVGGTRIGVARGIDRLLAGKVLDDLGAGSSGSAFTGMQWAVERGADVISMSLGFDFPGLVAARVAGGWRVEQATSSALEAYRSNLHLFESLVGLFAARAGAGAGPIVVAAAGNESLRDSRPPMVIAASLPAAATGVISVGAMEKSPTGWRTASFSNTQPTVCAPGVGITSARADGGLRVDSGTSMATPFVAGVVALWWEAMEAARMPRLAATATAKLLANATLTGLAPDVAPLDRGAGMVQAP